MNDREVRHLLTQHQSWEAAHQGGPVETRLRSLPQRATACSSDTHSTPSSSGDASSLADEDSTHDLSDAVADVDAEHNVVEQRYPPLDRDTILRECDLHIPGLYEEFAEATELNAREIASDETIMANKIINEEYKIWKKNAPYIYDVMYSKALDWPTLTTQWFRDVQNPSGEKTSIHRLLIGTHTSNGAPNYLQIAQFSLPQLSADAEDYDAERGEIGSGYNPSKKNVAPKFNISQKIDHDGEVNKARYMPQKQDIIATMGVNGRVMVFDRTKHPSQPTGTCSPQIDLVGHTREGYALDWHPNREGELFTGSEDGTVKLWNIKDFSTDSKKLKASRTFTHHSAVVNDVQVNPYIAKAIATVSDDHSLQIIDTNEPSDSRAAFKTEGAHNDAINSVSWNSGVEFILATGSADNSIGIWDLRNLSVKLHSCENHREVVSQVQWHPSKKAILASSSYDRRVCFWDLNRCGQEQTPEDAEDGPPELLFMHGGHTNRVSDFTFNLNDPWLMCSAAEDNLIQIWKPSEALLGVDSAGILLKEVGH